MKVIRVELSRRPRKRGGAECGERTHNSVQVNAARVSEIKESVSRQSRLFIEEKGRDDRRQREKYIERKKEKERREREKEKVR